MGDLTASFDAAEFRCPCNAPECDGGKMDSVFMNALQNVRDMCGFPFHINSGFRCAAHNKAIGGAPDSMHLLGRAADIGITDSMLRFHVMQMALRSMAIRGVGVAKTYLHLDDRDGALAMWVYPIR